MIFHFLSARVEIRNISDAVKGLAPAYLERKKYVHSATFVFDGSNEKQFKKMLRTYDRHAYQNGSGFTVRDKNLWKTTLAEVTGS